MDIISSLNSAFTQVQRFENMSFGSDGTSTKVGYGEHKTSSGATGLPGGRGGIHQYLSDTTPTSPRNHMQSAVSYDRSEGGGLQLRTQEGDVVRLSFLNSESANAQNQQFENGATTLTNFSLSGSNSSQFTVVVEGDLNGEELSAIRDVLIQAREMANTFFDGEVKEAFAMASQMNINSDQLANVNMQLNVSETYTYTQTSLESQNAQVPAPQPTLPIAPAVDSAPPAAIPLSTTPNADLVATLSQPSVAVAAPTASAPTVTNLTQDGPVRPDPVETPIHSAPDPVGSLADISATITSFLSQLTESLNSFNQQLQGPSQSSGASSAFSFSSGFQLQVVSSLISQMDSNSVGQATPAADLAAKTVDELAMKMDVFVDSMV